jgi:hypothetical protein
MRKMSFAIAIGLACAAAPALAQNADTTPPDGPSRFTFTRVNDGFLRLDSVSGHVAFCAPNSIGWACQTVPEDRAALDKEIARLQDEVTSLKAEVAALREPPPPRPPADLTPPSGRDDAAKLREDIGRARVALEGAWRRLVNMIMNFQMDMMRKG